LGASQVADLVKRMSVQAELSADNTTIKSLIPCTRSDILHSCDIMEDVAIAYGYNNLKIEPPKTQTLGKQQPINKLTDLLRFEVAATGFLEVLTFGLCSLQENFEYLNRPNDSNAIILSNPKTEEFGIARTSLLVGLLKTLGHNRSSALPIKIFEISDVVLKDSRTDVGARNQRNLCAIYCSSTPGFEIVQGLLDRVMEVTGVEWKAEGKKLSKGLYYYLKECQDPAFLEGKRANVYLNEKVIGCIGVVHPVVLKKFEIAFPCTALEICIEPFL